MKLKCPYYIVLSTPNSEIAVGYKTKLGAYRRYHKMTEGHRKVGVKNYHIAVYSRDEKKEVVATTSVNVPNFVHIDYKKLLKNK